MAKMSKYGGVQCKNNQIKWWFWLIRIGDIRNEQTCTQRKIGHNLRLIFYRKAASLTKSRATLVGFIAVLLWALLALFTAASGQVPPFQLTAMAFSIGAALGVGSWVLKPSRMRHLKQRPLVWICGVGGLFGYHFFYFTALRNAPAVEAGLIAYLWPLLIVLFSALLPTEKLGWHHVAGALIGFLGAGMIVTKGCAFSINPDYIFGYIMALVCAVIWSGYSVISRFFATVPTDVVTGFCLATAVLSLGCHFAFETTIWPSGLIEWLAVFGLGIGPLGIAFFTWDYGLKNGDIQVLGAASYAAPVLSTLVLIATGFAQFSMTIALACALVTGGAVLAAKDMIFVRV